MFENLYEYRHRVLRITKRNKSAMEFFGFGKPSAKDLQDKVEKHINDYIERMQMVHREQHFQEDRHRFDKLKSITNGKTIDTDAFSKLHASENTIFDGRKLLSWMKHINMYTTTMKQMLSVPITVPQEDCEKRKHAVDEILYNQPNNHPHNFQEYDRDSLEDGCYDNEDGKLLFKSAGYTPSYVHDVLLQESNVLRTIENCITCQKEIVARGHKLLELVKTTESPELLNYFKQTYEDMTDEYFFPELTKTCINMAIEIATHCYK